MFHPVIGQAEPRSHADVPAYGDGSWEEMLISWWKQEQVPASPGDSPYGDSLYFLPLHWRGM